MQKNPDSRQISNIDIRIHPELKRRLDLFCEENLEKISEAVSSAIKELIGFGKQGDSGMFQSEDDRDEGKTFRLNIRVHPRLKDALNEFCTRNNIKYTHAITVAIKKYIGFEERLN
jgi:hypothetical protein